MIGYLIGKVIEKEEQSATVLTGGVGYAVNIPYSFSAKLRKDEESEFYVYTHVREEALALYGFENQVELNFFKQLISVSGIGPKVALAILSSASVEKLKSSIAKGDSTLLSAVSGVGKKTAEKAVVELKNKVGGVSVSYAGDSGDILEALVGLGFQRAEAIEVISSLPEELETPEEKIKAGLKMLSRGAR